MQKFIDLRTLSLQDKTNLEYIEADKNHYASMTTIVGLKSIDGIILASDSQWTSDPIKNLAISKIFQINDSMGIGVSGIMTHISTLIQDLKKIDIDLTGGTTRVAIVDNNGFRELRREEVIDTYEAYRNAIAECLGSLVGIDKEQLKKLYPEP